MQKKVVLMALMAAVVLSFVIAQQMKKPTTTAKYTIGILQTASHPALDAVFEGFVEELKNRLGSEVGFVVKNIQGSIFQAHAVAQQFHANRQMQLIFAIATPAVQAVSAVEKQKSIVIAAVTDPNALEVVYPTTNVCGVTDAINVAAEIDMMVQLVPSVKTIGLMYASGETNSLVMVKKMRQELEARGLLVTDFAISNESDVQVVMELACRRVDVILAPTDNMIASTISLTSAVALKYKKPFIVSDNMLVKFGPLAARGVDYRASGKQAALVAYQVLVEGKKTYELPIEQANGKEIFVNQTTLDVLGLLLPATLRDDVILVS